MEESLLIEHCKKNHRQSQQLLFRLLSDSMLLLCIRYVKDHHHAEELMLNGFLNFFKHIARFEYKGPGSIEPWLRKIMVNECLMFLRKEKCIFLREEQAVTVASEQDTPLNTLQARELMALIRSMPDGYRTVFNLYAVEGYNHKKIAALLQISEGTSKSQLSKARTWLQESLKQKESNYAE